MSTTVLVMRRFSTTPGMCPNFGLFFFASLSLFARKVSWPSIRTAPWSAQRSRMSAACACGAKQPIRSSVSIKAGGANCSSFHRDDESEAQFVDFPYSAAPHQNPLNKSFHSRSRQDCQEWCTRTRVLLHNDRRAPYSALETSAESGALRYNL